MWWRGFSFNVNLSPFLSLTATDNGTLGMLLLVSLEE